MWKLAVFFSSLLAHESHGLLKDGAKKAEYGEFSYTVGIYEGIGDSFVQKCSGAILGAQFILTAAHCFFDEDLNLRDNIFQVLSGTDDAINKRPSQEETEVAEVRVPELFFHTPDGVALLSDIAVLKLKKPMTFYQSENQNQFVKKVALPERYFMHATSNAIVSGFGVASVKIEKGYWRDEIKFEYDGKGRLYYAEARILNMIECKRYYKNLNRDTALTFLHICARVSPQTSTIGGTCEKDAGAPLVYKDQIVGVLSNGPKHCDETISPGIYTRVLPHIGFIQGAMENNVTDPTIIVTTLP